MRIDKGSSVPEPKTSNKLHREAGQQDQAADQLLSENGGWREYSLGRATRMREFLRNAVMERRMSTAEEKANL